MHAAAPPAQTAGPMRAAPACVRPLFSLHQTLHGSSPKSKRDAFATALQWLTHAGANLTPPPMRSPRDALVITFPSCKCTSS